MVVVAFVYIPFSENVERNQNQHDGRSLNFLRVDEVDSQLGNGRKLWNPNEVLIMYNRVPKTGSTSFMATVQQLCKSKSQCHAIHLNITKNRHVLNLADQVFRSGPEYNSSSFRLVDQKLKLKF